MKINSYRYAGIEKVHVTGLSVPNSAEQIRRFAYLEERLMFLLAAHHVSVAHRDLKMLLGRLQYEDATHSDALRKRLNELRVPKGRMKSSPDKALTLLMNEAEHSENVPELLTAVADVLKPALVQAYENYLQACNPLADSPTVRILQQILVEEKEHLRLLRLAWEDLVKDAAERAATSLWLEKIRAFLKAAGGVNGLSPEKAELQPIRSQQSYRIPRQLSRDHALKRVWDYEAPPQDDVGRHAAYLMGLRMSEVNVSEGLAIVLFEVKDKPWEFYADISRHLWDEVRHSLFGEAAIEATCGSRDAVPMRDYEGVYCMEAETMEQYATLGLEVEGANMKYPVGKRGEWEFFRERARHPLMTTFQDFDWADEVLHVHIARRRLENWFVGSPEELARFAEAGKKHRSEIKKRGKGRALPDLLSQLQKIHERSAVSA